MTAEQFAYSMQGFAELSGDEPPTPAQWKSMREHLQTVFVKVTPRIDVGPGPFMPHQNIRFLTAGTPQWPAQLTPHCAAGSAHGQVTC